MQVSQRYSVEQDNIHASHLDGPERCRYTWGYTVLEAVSCYHDPQLPQPTTLSGGKFETKHLEKLIFSPYSVGTNLSRQNLTSKDVRF